MEAILGKQIEIIFNKLFQIFSKTFESVHQMEPSSNKEIFEQIRAETAKEMAHTKLSTSHITSMLQASDNPNKKSKKSKKNLTTKTSQVQSVNINSSKSSKK
jgi:exopolysaccharide biosynthesis protein